MGTFVVSVGSPPPAKTALRTLTRSELPHLEVDLHSVIHSLLQRERGLLEVLQVSCSEALSNFDIYDHQEAVYVPFRLGRVREGRDVISYHKLCHVNRERSIVTSR